MKKRRLKRSVKRKIIKAWVFTKRVSIASLVSFGTIQTFLPVHAEINEKEIIKLTAQLQHTDLSNSSELKQAIVDTYNSVNNTEENVEETKVYVTTPAVVTTPTINNATITVVTKEQNSETQSTEDKTTNTQTEEKTESEVSNPEKETNEAKEDTSNKETTDNKKEETKVIETDNSVEKAEANKTQVDEKKEDTKSTASAETETTNSKSDNTSTTVENTETTVLPSTQFVPTASDAQILSTASTNDEVDLDNVESKEVVKIGSMSLILSAESVTVDSSSDFTPEDYILELKGTGDLLPALTIDNPVNVYKDGDYVVTYKVTDITGNSITKTLNVTVKTTEEMLKQRKEATEKNIQEFVEETSGRHIDEDGYYGDQCWDLWGYFNRVKGLTDFDEGCSPYGYVYGIPLKYKTSGASKYYKYINAGETLKVGDWLFWNKASSYSASHVALLLGINEDGTLKCLTQSYGEGTRVLDLQPDIMAAFRLKGSYEWWNLD